MVKEYLSDVVLFLHENTYMKLINTIEKKIWMIKMLPGNTKSTCSIKHCKGLDEIGVFENIHLIQVCIYHYYCKTSSKGH